jgi:hypothetical protein
MVETAPLGRVTVPATKSKKTSPDVIPVISVPVEVVRRDPN